MSPNRHGPYRSWLPHEEELVRGAAQMGFAALRECAEYLCRPYVRVRIKAAELRSIAAVVEARRVYEITRQKRLRSIPAESSIPYPTPAQMMVPRARVRRMELRA